MVSVTEKVQPKFFEWDGTHGNTVTLVKFMRNIAGKQLNIVTELTCNERPTVVATEIVNNGLVFKFFNREYKANYGDYIVYCAQNKIFYPMSVKDFEALYN